jgi:hypothetical protein
MKLGPGTRLKSTVCETELIVVRLSGDDVDLCCGGHPMVALGDDASLDLALDPAFDEGTTLGKRYTDAAGDIELLCTKAGKGSLSVGGEPLVLKEAKPLPSSD